MIRQLDDLLKPDCTLLERAVILRALRHSFFHVEARACEPFHGFTHTQQLEQLLELQGVDLGTEGSESK